MGSLTTEWEIRRKNTVLLVERYIYNYFAIVECAFCNVIVCFWGKEAPVKWKDKHPHTQKGEKKYASLFQFIVNKNKDNIAAILDIHLWECGFGCLGRRHRRSVMGNGEMLKRKFSFTLFISMYI